MWTDLNSQKGMIPSALDCYTKRINITLTRGQSSWIRFLSMRSVARVFSVDGWADYCPNWLYPPTGPTPQI